MRVAEELISARVGRLEGQLFGVPGLLVNDVVVVVELPEVDGLQPSILDVLLDVAFNG